MKMKADGKNVEQGAGKLAPSLSNLEFLARDMRTADKFSEMYISMLNDARLRQDLVFIRKMQRILIAQSRFMVREFKAAGGRFEFELHEGPEPKALRKVVQK